MALSCVILFWRIVGRSGADDLDRVIDSARPLPESHAEGGDAEADDVASISWVSFYLATDEPWEGERVVEVLTDYGFHYEKDSGLFVYEAEHAPWFRVAQATHPVTFDMDRVSELAVSGLAFFMDATEVEEPKMVFSRMVALMQSMSRELNALLVDQSQKPLTPDDLSRILRQLPEAALVA